MLTGSERRLLKATAGRWLADSFALCIPLVPLVLGLRLYELLLIHQRYDLPDSAAALVVRVLAYDVMVIGVIILLGVLLYMPLRVVSRHLAVSALVLWNSCLLIGYVALIEYFAQTQVPLGADLFGYSAADISATVRTSSDFSLTEWLPFVLVVMLYWVAVLWRHPWQPGTRLCRVYGVAILLLPLAFLLLYPQQDVLTSERRPALAANKMAAFAMSSLRHFTETRRPLPAPLASPGSDESLAVDAEYPLWHEAAYDNVLGPYFRRTGQPPNIVIIGVEGLGRAFAPQQRYGGFTPFFAGLIADGLYFPNFIATSGRSFGFLPSLIGSLPPARSGFMGLGAGMPAHDSLITLLNANDYLTNYYIGFNSNFDNIDVFLERQRVDFLLNEGMFGPGYEKMDMIEGGFTWGYADRDLYQRAFEYLDGIPPEQPRLDIYHTVNLHEPFIIPDTRKWHAAVDRRADELELSARQRRQIEQYREIFAALLYSDAALEYLLQRYRQREDFDRTIFIITGDHRLIPIPEENRIDRFSVPLLIWSPMLQESGQFNAVSSHLDVVPTLIAYLRDEYGLKIPQEAHWLGRGIDMHESFRSRRSAPLMRTKNELRDYIAGEYFLSGSQLFRLLPGMELEPVSDRDLRDEITRRFDRFRAVNHYVTASDRLKPVGDELAEDRAEREALVLERALLRELGLGESGTEELFEAARQAAFNRDYETARLIGRHVLRNHPNYHDMRALLGRIHAWNGEYEQAREYLNDVLRRNPLYTDAYDALADAERWAGEPGTALKVVERGLGQVPQNVPLLLKKAQLQYQMNHAGAALETVNTILTMAPDNARAREMQQEIQQATRKPE